MEKAGAWSRRVKCSWGRLWGEGGFELLAGLFCSRFTASHTFLSTTLLCQADQNTDFFSISCIFYFLASCGFCGAVGPVRRPSQGSLHKECLQSVPMILSMQLCLFDEQDYSQSLLYSAVVLPFLVISPGYLTLHKCVVPLSNSSVSWQNKCFLLVCFQPLQWSCPREAFLVFSVGPVQFQTPFLSNTVKFF